MTPRRRHRRCMLALAAPLALLALAPATSSAVTFGANLSRAANNTTPCNSPSWFFYYSFPTCSFESQVLSTGENGFPPAGRGVVTKVRVKVGSVTGPMQIVVEEALRRDNPSDPGHPTYACCKAINASSIFTPTANAVTEVATNLPVRQDISPDPATGNFVDDHLSLSVLAPNVPIPANLDPNASLGGWFPAWQVGQERVDTYGTQGGVILFNADWSPGSAAANCPGKSQAQSSKKKKKKKKSPCAKKKKKKKKKRKG